METNALWRLPSFIFPIYIAQHNLHSMVSRTKDENEKAMKMEDEYEEINNDCQRQPEEMRARPHKV